MQKVTDISEYRAAIQSVKNRFGTCESNCFCMSDSIRSFIVEDRFYMQEYKHGTAFFIDEGAYYCLYYFRKSGAKLDDFRQEKPVVIEESNRNGARDTYLASFEPLLMEAGFRLFKTNLQLEMALRGKKPVLMEKLSVGLRRLDELGLSLAFSDGKDSMRQAIALWESALDPTDIPWDHRMLGEQDSLLCVLDSENRVVATNWWRITGKSAEGRHIVTHPDYYHKGIASLMLAKECLCAMENGVERVLGWSHDNNLKSLELQQKAGFSFNGKTCKQYILN